MLNVPSVISNMHNGDKWPKWFSFGEERQFHTNMDLQSAYSINDDIEITDLQRESKLSALFAKHNDTLIFVD